MDGGVDVPAPGPLVPALLTRLTDLRSRPPLVVLDPAWPSPLVQDARTQVVEAVAAGRLTSGDLVLFTSGSSGRPRGVVRTVDSWRASLAPLSDLIGIGRDVVAGPVWVPGPMTSSLFLYGAVHAAWTGLGWVTGRPVDAHVQAATAAHLVPTQLAGALDVMERGLLRDLRVAVVAGAHLPTPLRVRAERQGLRLVEYYGAAELSFVGWRPDDGPFAPFPGAQTRVSDDGVLWVRSPYTARGYLQPEADGPWRQVDGWHTVGDRARPEKPGRAPGSGWSLLGRGDTVVTTGGHTVVAAEVEEALREVDGVADVVVLGLAHDRLGEVVAAVVRPEARHGDGVRVRLLAATRRLPSPSRPRLWLRADELPLLASGKVDREALRAVAPTLPRL